jgi:hypothetical protein
MSHPAKTRTDALDTARKAFAMVFLVTGCSLNHAVNFRSDGGPLADGATLIDAADTAVPDVVADASDVQDVTDATRDVTADAPADVTDVPVVDVPVVDVPVVDVPVVDVPVVDVPVVDVPVVDVPVVDVPVVDVSVDVPVVDVPPIDVPIVDVPPIDVPVVDVPVADTSPDVPVVDVPVADVPVDSPPVLVPITPTDRCADAPAMRADIGTWLYDGTTQGSSFRDDSRGRCNLEGTNRSDVVYSLTLPETRRVTLTVTSTRTDRVYNPVLYVSRGCDGRVVNADGSRELEVACVDDVAGSYNPTMSLVLPAGNYRIFVDGDDLGGGMPAGEGPFRLTARIDAAPTRGRVEVVPSGACPTWPVAATAIANTLGDDVVSAVLTLPFPLRWYGADVTRYAVSSNGYVQLSPPSMPGSEFVNQAVPGTVSPNGVLAPWWDDLVTDTAFTGRVESAVFGSAPNRVFAIRWNDASRYADPATRLTFEARLYETSSTVEFHYCRTFGVLPYSLSSATIGVESLDGTDGVAYALDENRLVANQILRFTQP